MFSSIMSLQWKVSRWTLAILVPICLALPLLVLQFAARIAQGLFAQPANDMLRAVQIWTPVFPVLAAVTGVVFGLTAWTWDHSTNHVYALSLPMERWRYALLKMGAAALTLAVPVFAVLVGALIATSTTELPSGIHGYPVAFTLRFLFASLILYAITFAAAAGTIRTALTLVIGFVVLFFFGTVFIDLISSASHVHITTPIELLENALTIWAGPFQVFGGNWMLIDV